MTAYRKYLIEFGELVIQPISLDRHIPFITEWVNQEYASFWGMIGYSQEKVRANYEDILSEPNSEVLIGLHKNKPAFLVELYDPKHQEVGKHYEVEKGDRGLHILMAPIASPEKRIPNFTFHIFSTVMERLFNDVDVSRVVVEPDARNEKIHHLNQRVGFHHVKEIGLSNKRALLGFCTREQFESRMHYPLTHFKGSEVAKGLNSRLSVPDSSVSHINEENWQNANRHLVKKMLSEFSHERLLAPALVDESANRSANAIYQISSDDETFLYRFEAKLLGLNHWAIDERTIEKHFSGQPEFNGNQSSAEQLQSLNLLDASQFILEFNDRLGIPQENLGTYLEEINSTLVSSCYKLAQFNPNTHSAESLAGSDYQTIEAAMTEGHPSFVANNGRVGVNAADYPNYAPEVATPMQILWIAVHKDRSAFVTGKGIDQESLFEQELDFTSRKRFNMMLKERDLKPEDYHLMPVHPWQWFNKLAIVYGVDIANQHIVCLDYSDDQYQAQQSIRTFFNVSNPKKHYVKTAMSILNMGFMRGLSAYYMKSTPAINDWLNDLVLEDDYLQEKGFMVLRELAAVGYENPYFLNPALQDNPYKKMLAALWRENPYNKIASNQQLATMASLLHVDAKGNALLSEYIKQSGLTTDEWLHQYVDAYLSPLLHCYFAHSLVFMPHGENVILVMENNRVVATIAKDIGEEICLLNADSVVVERLPEEVRRIAIEVPKEHEILSFFTDVFDGFFRYVVEILETKMDYPEQEFWNVVTQVVEDYQQSHPEFQEKYLEHNLFQGEFLHSCLNRLQLNNNRQMLNLADPSSALQFAGYLENPISSIKHSKYLDVRSIEVLAGIS